MYTIEEIIETKKLYEMRQEIVDKIVIFGYNIIEPRKKNIFKPDLIKSSENAWNLNHKKTRDRDSDKKKLVSLLNKLTNDNYDKILESTKEIDLDVESMSELVDILFNKAVSEPFFSELYARLCEDLNLHCVLNQMCSDQFSRKKNKNLCKFICALYKKRIVANLDSFIKILMDNLDEINLEILVTLIKNVGPKEEMFENIINYLKQTKDSFKPRYKFMVMDLIDAKN